MSAFLADRIAVSTEAPFGVPSRAAEGLTVFCLGSGPRSAGFPRKALEGLPVLCCNCEVFSYERGVCVYMDAQWARWNSETLLRRRDLVFTVSSGVPVKGLRVHRLRHRRLEHLCERPGEVSGSDSGAVAMNLAFHLGASRVALVGYDQTTWGDDEQTHWHRLHPKRSEASTIKAHRNRNNNRLPVYRERGVRVVSLTDTALQVKRRDPARVIEESRREVAALRERERAAS